MEPNGNFGYSNGYWGYNLWRLFDFYVMQEVSIHNFETVNYYVLKELDETKSPQDVLYHMFKTKNITPNQFFIIAPLLTDKNKVW